MTSQKQTGIALAVMGVILLIVASTIETPWNSGTSMFDSSDNYQENILLKRIVQYGGVFFLLIGALIFFIKRCTPYLVFGILFLLIGVYLTAISIYGIIFFFFSDIGVSEEVRKWALLINGGQLLIGMGLGFLGYRLLRKNTQLQKLQG